MLTGNGDGERCFHSIDGLDVLYKVGWKATCFVRTRGRDPSDGGRDHVPIHDSLQNVAVGFLSEQLFSCVYVCVE